MKTLSKVYEYQATLDDVWKCFTDPKYIEAWDAGPVEMTDKEGSEFKLWGGDVWGKNLKVIKGKALEQAWSSVGWESPSKVKFTFEEDNGKVKVTLKQSDIPDNELKSTDSGWDDYYLGAITTLLTDKKLGRHPELQ